MEHLSDTNLGRYSCAQLEGSVMFLANSAITVCCFIDDYISVPLDGPESFKVFKDTVDAFKSDPERIVEHPICSKCPNLQIKQWPITNGIQEIILSTNMRCNLDCKYCGQIDNKFKVPYDLLEQLRFMFNNGMVSPDFSACWGGKGEPVIDVNFEPVMELFFEKKVKKVQVFTNSTVYSRTIEEGLSEGRVTVVTSPDSGTWQTFYKIKRRNLFERTWQNIKKYSEADRFGNLYVKYIVTEDNCHNDEVAAFIEQCKTAKVKLLQISVNNKQEVEDSVFLGVTNLWLSAESSGLNVTFRKGPSTPIERLQKWAAENKKNF